MVRPRERLAALVAVALVQAALALALLSGFRVEISRAPEAIERLIDVRLQPPPPPSPPPRAEPKRAAKPQSSAPKAEPKPIGGSPGPKPAHAPPSVTPVVALRSSAAPSGGGKGTGPALGSGAGGGTGGQGYGADDGGGTDLVQIAGAIGPSDYPRDLRERGAGGRVEFTFTVEPNGRVGRCSITRSSGIPELDALTCRLVQQRFVYRPSTDRYGRPIEDEVDGVQDWVPSRG
jgi:protein TonB